MHYSGSFKSLLSKFENKQPEIVFHWKDSETEAEGWTVINSLRGGSAGGGTRMRKGLDMREVESLAKTMEVKFSVCGPPIGGAKSGINFDPADPRKEGVLKRWYKAVHPLLKNYYGTGGDLNVDEIHEVIPMTAANGLLHPQEGTVNGHYGSGDPLKMQRIAQLQTGVSKVLDDARYSPSLDRKYTVADMITGWGVAEAVRLYYQQWGLPLQGKRAIVQGWGNVGAAAAWYLSRMGVPVLGILDRDGGLIDQKGMDEARITQLFLNRQGNKLTDTALLPFDQVNEQIWNLGAEIFVPAAASRLVTAGQVQALVKGGIECISCGANVPFADQEIFIGPTADEADDQTAIIPDFIANCGMARVFAYLMGENAQLTDEAIFTDVSRTIGQTLQRLHAFNPKHTGLAKKGLEMSLSTLV